MSASTIALTATQAGFLGAGITLLVVSLIIGIVLLVFFFQNKKELESLEAKQPKASAALESKRTVVAIPPPPVFALQAASPQSNPLLAAIHGQKGTPGRAKFQLGKRPDSAAGGAATPVQPVLALQEASPQSNVGTPPPPPPPPVFALQAASNGSPQATSPQSTAVGSSQATSQPKDMDALFASLQSNPLARLKTTPLKSPDARQQSTAADDAAGGGAQQNFIGELKLRLSNPKPDSEAVEHPPADGSVWQVIPPKQTTGLKEVTPNSNPKPPVPQNPAAAALAAFRAKGANKK